MAITKILNINEADDRNPGAHLEHAITYIQNPDKTNEKVWVGSINCLPETAFSQMMDTKQMFGKTGKRQGYHIVSLPISLELSMDWNAVLPCI